jgi:hypothetical protein
MEKVMQNFLEFDNGTIIALMSDGYKANFPKYPELSQTERWLYGMWIIGNNYKLHKIWKK